MAAEHYHKCLGKFGYLVRKADLTESQEKEIKKELTVQTTVLPAYKDFQKPKTYRIYFHSANLYYLPRFYGINKFGPPQYTTLTPGVPISVRCDREPLPHQKTATQKLDEIFDPAKQVGDGGVLSLPCGYGKTFCAIRTICRLGVAGLIVVPTECLMDQWMDAIRTFVPTAKVGYIQQGHVDVDDKDFVVAMLHSLCLKDYPVEIFDHFGITVFDECHHIASEVFCKAMMKIRTKFTLGLSATPERRDGLSRVFYEFIGPLLHKERRAGTNTVIIKKFLLHSTSVNYQKQTMSNGITNTSSMTTAISKLQERNDLLIFIIRSLILQNRKILVLSSRKEHLHTIKDALDAAGIKNPVTGQYITYGFYYGKSGMTRQAHKALLTESAKCDVVLGIDVIAKEGLDIPDLNTLIFSTPPGVEVEQPVGRILRKFHKSLNPLVIDLVDNTGNYVKHSKERDKWYREEDYEIQEREVELLDDPTLWQDRVTDYIQRVHVQAVKKRKVMKALHPPPEEEPPLGELLLQESDEEATEQAVPKVAQKINPKPRAKPTITVRKEPNASLCLLDSALPAPKPQVRAKEINLDKPMI